MSDSPEFQLFLSMKRYFQFQQAVHKDRDNTEDAQKRSNAHAILQYCESVKTEIWDQLNSKLMPLMESNKISQSLSEPRSDQDFDVLEFLMRYVHTDPDQRCNLLTPLARPIPPTWTEWFKQKGVSWISFTDATSSGYPRHSLLLEPLRPSGWDGTSERHRKAAALVWVGVHIPHQKFKYVKVLIRSWLTQTLRNLIAFH